MFFLSAVLSCAVRLDGMIVGIKLLTVSQTHFLWEAFDLGAVSSSKRFALGEDEPGHGSRSAHLST